MNLSALVITKNAQSTLDRCLFSLKSLADEIIIVDDYSSDQTLEIARKYTDKIFSHRMASLGRQKQWGIDKAKNNWILLLDSDEVVSKDLREEIVHLKLEDKNISGYFIRFANYFLGRRVCHGGENYKVLRLINKKYAQMISLLVHEKVILKKGKIKELAGKIYHYSYRSIGQVYKKFTRYAFLEAAQKRQKGERASLKKIFLYPPHMFWARFFKDKGYKDGLFRIPLDLGFAYMEFLTYFLLLVRPAKKK